jgi:threonine synthase
MRRPRETAAGAPGFRTVCTACAAPLPAGFAPACPSCGGLTDVEYDLTAVELAESPNPYRRFAALLPVRDATLLPGDAEFTPTIHATRLGDAVGMPWLYLKDETNLPTGTTKDRMAAVALAYLAEQGVRAFAMSSTGNSSTAFARAVTRFPGHVVHVFTASQFADRVLAGDNGQVRHVVLPGATFVEAATAARDYASRHGIVFEAGFFNPGRREGLKLAWLEAAEQVSRPIDWYVQAVSSGMGVCGVFKGANELVRLGRADLPPRLLCVQQDTCAPMVSAWASGSARIRPEDVVDRPRGIATAILRGDPSAAYPHLAKIVAASGGTFTSVGEREMREARALLEELEGLSPCFAAAAALAGVIALRRRGELTPEDTVLVNVTGRDREPAGTSARREVRRRTARRVAEVAVDGLDDSAGAVL